MSMKQDVKLLSENIVSLGGIMLSKLFKEKGLNPADVGLFSSPYVQRFLPHQI